MSIERRDRRTFQKPDESGSGPAGVGEEMEQRKAVEGILSPEEMATLYETYREAGGDRIAAHLVEANNVLTIAGARTQTEFFMEHPTPSDYIRLKAVAAIATKSGIEIMPTYEFDSPPGMRTLMVNVFNSKALERLSHNPPIPGLPLYDATTGIEGAQEWASHTYSALEEMQLRGDIPPAIDLSEIIVGLEKGYPWVAILDVAQAVAEDRSFSDFPSSRLLSADIYGGARPEFDFAADHEDDPSILTTVKKWESILADFYATDWHKNIATDPTFRSERLASQGLSHNQLQQQIRLPKSEWSPEFKAHIDRLVRDEEWRQVHEEIRSLDDEREVTYRHYLRSLGLEQNMIRNTKIIDLGCGDGGFVITCLKKNITREAYGIDAAPEIKGTGDYQDHILVGDFEKPLSLSGANYVLSVGAASLGIDGENGLEHTKQILDNALAAAVEHGGEVRIFPINEAAVANQYEHAQKLRARWERIREQFSEAGIEAHIEPRGIYVTGKNNDVILASVLILKKPLSRIVE